MKKEFQHIMPDHRLREPMDENVVQKLIGNYLRLWGYHEFRLENIESKGEKYEVSAIAPGDIHMDRMFVVDKHSGWVQSVPQAD